MTNRMHSAVIETRGLTKRYRRVTALSDCSVTVPEGRICALVGPNGAGKTTLLRLLAGLARPTSGRSGAGRHAPPGPGLPGRDRLPGPGDPAVPAAVPPRITSSVGAHLNRRWDAARCGDAADGLNIPLDQAVGTLSGGQRAQLALALTLAKRPRLLLLDEPVAALDPLARRHFLATLADAVAGGGLTVVLSSHLIADMERVCDHLILLAASQVQLCGDIDDGAGRAPGPGRPAQGHHGDREGRTPRAGYPHRPADARCSSGWHGPVIDPAWEAAEVGLEEMVLGYMGQDAPPAFAHLTTVGEGQ